MGDRLDTTAPGMPVRRLAMHIGRRLQDSMRYMQLMAKYSEFKQGRDAERAAQRREAKALEAAGMHEVPVSSQVGRMTLGALIHYGGSRG